MTLADLVEDLADLRFGDDQRRAHRDGIARRAEHQTVLVERTFQRLEAALADGVGPAGEIDADGQANRADIEHVRAVP